MLLSQLRLRRTVHGRPPKPRHPAQTFVSVSAPCRVGLMSTKRQRATGGGRPGKGDRHPFAVRVPREYADRVMAYADATDQTYNDVIVGQIIRHIDELDVDALQLGHNRLDIDTDAKTG